MTTALVHAATAFAVGRFGPTIDPTGAHVLFRGKLWEVTGAGYSELPAAFVLNLRSFDRSLTATAPMSACMVLPREGTADADVQPCDENCHCGTCDAPALDTPSAM